MTRSGRKGIVDLRLAKVNISLHDIMKLERGKARRIVSVDSLKTSSKGDWELL